MRALLLASMVLLAGCPHPVPPPRPPAKMGDMSEVPACVLPPGSELPTYRDVCGGLVHNNRACVRCHVMHACLETADMMYCVRGDDCSDPACVRDGSQPAE